MVLRQISILFILCISTLYAHRVAGVNMDSIKIKNNKVQIKAYFKKSKKPLWGNEVRLISMFDNRILSQGKLTRKGLILDIPRESYWVYILVRDNDIVQDGPSPDGGFDKAVKIEKIAFLYTSVGTLFFIILGSFIGYRQQKLFKQSLS